MFKKKNVAKDVQVVLPNGDIVGKPKRELGLIGKLAIGAGALIIGKCVYDKGYDNGWCKGIKDRQQQLDYDSEQEAKEDNDNDEEGSE